MHCLIGKLKWKWHKLVEFFKYASETEKIIRSFAIFYMTLILTIVILLAVIAVNQSRVNDILLTRTATLIEEHEAPATLSAAGDISVAPLNVTAEEEQIAEPEEEIYIPEVSEDEIELIARITWCEAGTECEEGKRLVIDTILNRVDDEHFPDSIEGVIFQPNQFSPVSNGSFDKAEVKDDIYQLVLEELECRTDDEVLYFRTGRYHKWGTPLFQVGNHYFSGN